MRPTAPPSALVVDIAALRRRHVAHHRLAAPLSVELLREALSDTDADLDAPGEISFDLVLQGDGSVVATGRLRLDFHVPCARCLEPAAVQTDTPITALFVTDLAARKPVAAEEDEADVEGTEDLWGFDGVHLDLRPLVAEYVKLAYPMRALCPRQEACRGLCTGCGAPLNEQPVDAPTCARCGRKDPVVPLVDEIPEPGDAPGPTNPLAAALAKVRLPE